MDKLLHAIPLLLCLLIVGAAACLPLYRWRLRVFLASSLAVKIVIWVPLYLLFYGAVTQGTVTGAFVGGVIALVGLAEWYLVDHQKRTRYYLIFFLVGCLAWPLSIASSSGQVQWVALCLVSVFSDVVAFFMGKYGGLHKLPKFINERKSYEGLVGQVIGGVLGVLVFSWIYSTNLSLLLGFGIGIASGLGDIANSIAKRRIGVKDWARTIPGHGGVLDRFSSLNAALILVAFIR
jgi:CDP-diglyceride synthetase